MSTHLSTRSIANDHELPPDGDGILSSVVSAVGHGGSFVDLKKTTCSYRRRSSTREALTAARPWRWQRCKAVVAHRVVRVGDSSLRSDFGWTDRVAGSMAGVDALNGARCWALCRDTGKVLARWRKEGCHWYVTF